MKNRDEHVHELVTSAVSRRRFAKQAITAGFTIGAAGLLDGAASSADAQALSDVDILNFALNLEYLEAEFYTVLTSGVTIDMAPYNIGIGGTGTPGPTTGATRLDFAGDRLLEQTALELAHDERSHVEILREALGSNAVAKPAISFGFAGVTTIARFLQAARVLEDVGVSAYGGAAPLISNTTTLGAAVKIGLVEANHSGSIRYQLAREGVGDIGPVDEADVVVGSPAQVGSRLVDADGRGLAPVRTPSQVLAIVYGPNAPAGTMSGGFFPNGMNGTIRMV
ncbi:MAG: ferritin-like domain-containing protein [Vicinamibacterales bacterium]